MGLEFTGYLVCPERWGALPGDWAAVFDREAPLALDIGFGNGEFLAEAAQEHPDWNWVGFETSLTCLVKAGRKLAQAGTENVRLALADGKFALRELFPDERVSRVYVHFPCPWPKARHAQRRLVDQELAQTLSAVLVPEGLFILVTDVLPYAEEAAAGLAGEGRFHVTGPELLGDSGPGTRYEQKWRNQGRTIWRVVARRVVRGKAERIAEGIMPHARIAVAFSPERAIQLVGLKETWPRGAFVIKEAFLGQDGRVVLLRTFASDAAFQQHYLLAVVEDHGGTMVTLDEATVPFRTPAVKRSVAAAARALEGT